jgi:hypothetical protein
LTPCGFTRAHYREVLGAAVSSYSFVSYDEAASPEAPPRFVVLRHDVDFSLEDALPLAEIEAGLGVRATYFVLPHGPYNLLGPPSFGLLRRILDLGHHLGVHYDVGFYAAQGVPARDTLLAEARLLETRFDTRVLVAAEHNPGLAPRPPGLTVEPLLDAYGPGFTRELKYLSDSCQFWRESCFCAFLRERRAPRLQVLTHPLWWSEEGRPADEALLALTRRRVDWAQADEARVFRHFGRLEHLGNREIFRKHT